MKPSSDSPPFRLAPAGWALLLCAAGALLFAISRLLSAPSTKALAAAATDDPDRSYSRTPRVASDGASGERVALAPVAEPAASVEEYLRNYWGERWPEIQTQNQASADWLARYPLAELKPWDEVSEQLLARALSYLKPQREDESYLQLSGERGLIDLAEEQVRLKVGEGVARDFERIREPARAAAEALRAGAAAYHDELERCIARRWREGLVAHHPILGDYAPLPEGLLYHQAGAEEGWTYRIQFLPQEEPELARLAAEFESLKSSSFEILASFYDGD